MARFSRCRVFLARIDTDPSISSSLWFGPFSRSFLAVIPFACWLILGVPGAVFAASATDSAPVVTAPASESGAEGSLLSFTVSASDPDGDAITSLTAGPLPSGATFTPNGTNTSGTFNWTPDFTQYGGYYVTFTA